MIRAVENVLDNAVRYTPAGGEVRAMVRCAGESISFNVMDTGPGLAPDDLPHIFAPLFRGEARGTGAPAARDWD